MKNRVIRVNLFYWLTVLFHPRETLSKMIDTPKHRKEYGDHAMLLAALIGILYALDNLSTKHVGDFLSLSSILAIAIIGGPIIGIIWLYAMALLLKWTGNGLGGHAPASHLRIAYAMSAIPYIWTLPYRLVAIAIMGSELFTSAKPDLRGNLFWALVLLGIIGSLFISGIWWFALLVATVSEAQRFSLWRAVGSIVLTYLILLLPVVCILALAPGLTFR